MSTKKLNLLVWLVSFLFIPAFMFGVAMVWTISFAVTLVLYVSQKTNVIEAEDFVREYQSVRSFYGELKRLLLYIGLPFLLLSIWLFWEQTNIDIIISRNKFTYIDLLQLKLFSIFDLNYSQSQTILQSKIDFLRNNILLFSVVFIVSYIVLNKRKWKTFFVNLYKKQHEVTSDKAHLSYLVEQYRYVGIVSAGMAVVPFIIFKISVEGFGLWDNQVFVIKVFFDVLVASLSLIFQLILMLKSYRHLIEYEMSGWNIIKFQRKEQEKGDE